MSTARPSPAPSAGAADPPKIVEGLIGGLGDVPSIRPPASPPPGRASGQALRCGVSLLQLAWALALSTSGPEAEVGEKHLSLLLKDHFFLLIFQGQGHIFKESPCICAQVSPPPPVEPERAWGGTMVCPADWASRYRPPWSRWRGGQPAGGQDHRPAGRLSPQGHANHPPLGQPQFLRLAPAQDHALPFSGQKTRRRSRRPPGLNRKNTPPLALSSGDAQGFKIFHTAAGGNRVTALYKSARFGSRAPARPRGRVVGQVAPAFAGDVQLAAQLLVGSRGHRRTPGVPTIIPAAPPHHQGSASLVLFLHADEYAVSSQMCSSRSKWSTTSDLLRAMATSRELLIRLRGSHQGVPQREAMSLLASST